jgi:DNA-binding CsgD family transcriptional regulator
MQLDRAISAFAGAALSTGSWPDALETVARTCSARFATLVAGGAEGTLVCSRDARDAIDLYLHRREVPDSRHRRVMPTLAGGFRTDDDDFTPREIAVDPYYQEFLAPLDIHWHAAAALPGLGAPLVLSLKRSQRQGPFGRAEIDRLDRLLPALRSAARTAAVIGRTRIDGELAAFARLQRGALTVDAEAAVLVCNEIVAFGDGLLNDAGRLSAARSTDRDALRRAIASAAAGSAAAPVVVQRPSGRRPLVVDVVPLPASELGAPQTRCALVIVNDPQLARLPSPALLCAAYALSPREAELTLHIAAGTPLREAASLLRISEAHARQRLKIVFAKTRITRQSELVLQVARMA